MDEWHQIFAYERYLDQLNGVADAKSLPSRAATGTLTKSRTIC